MSFLSYNNWKEKHVLWRWRRLLATSDGLIISIDYYPPQPLCPTTTKPQWEEGQGWGQRAWPSSKIWPGHKAGKTQDCRKFCRAQERTVKSCLKKRTKMPANRAHPSQSGWESGREIQKLRCAVKWVSVAMESSKQGNRGGIVWDSKEEIYIRAWHWEPCLMFAWMVFLKGPLTE